jgi:medium-chain acyl-[acyl-carrier-protein] hydrolase
MHRTSETISRPTAHPWEVVFHRRPQAALRLVCIPYAGAGPALFRSWSVRLPEQIEVVGIELPGRESSWRAEPLTRVADIVQRLSDHLEATLDRPSAVFGHSLGGLIGFELARELTRRGLPPAHTFVSACRPPGTRSPWPDLHRLPDATFVAEVQQRYQGIPDAFSKDAEVMAMLLPRLRADFEALETHRHLAGEPLSCPLTVFGGTTDRTVPVSDLSHWRPQTTAEFDLRMVVGDHLYLQDAQATLLAAVGEALAPLVTEAA